MSLIVFKNNNTNIYGMICLYQHSRIVRIWNGLEADQEIKDDRQSTSADYF